MLVTKIIIGVQHYSGAADCSNMVDIPCLLLMDVQFSLCWARLLLLGFICIYGTACGCLSAYV